VALATLLEALAVWRRESESACGASGASSSVELLVAETLPQHFDWSSSSGSGSGGGSSSGSGSGGGSIGIGIGIGSGSGSGGGSGGGSSSSSGSGSSSGGSSAAAAAECRGNSSSGCGCRRDTPRPYLAASPYLRSSAQVDGLAARARLRAEQAGAPLEDWHNALAAPLLARLGARRVPLFAALRTRGELHRPGDCLHWCEATEATQHMATAVLAVLAASASPE